MKDSLLDSLKKRGPFPASALTHGFVIIVIFFLGVGLEQAFLTQPRPALEYAFLGGVLLGLGLGVFLLPRLPFPIHSQARFLSVVSGLLAGLFLWKEWLLLSLLAGLSSGMIFLTLYPFTRNKPFEDLLREMAWGIILGNLAIFVLKFLPRLPAVLFLSFLIASWRPQRGEGASFFPLFERPSADFVALAFFVFFFYTIGGLYYLAIFEPERVPFFHLFSPLAYILGLGLLWWGRRALSYVPVALITVLGLTLIYQFARPQLSWVSLIGLELTFGAGDLFALSAIFVLAKSLGEVALGIALFPLAILAGTAFLLFFPLALQKYQGAFFLIFLAFLPGAWLSRTLLKGEGPWRREEPRKGLPQGPALALPAGEGPAPSWKEVLSPREKEICELLLEGYKLREIAQELGLALGTVKALCNRIYEKLDVQNKKELCERFGSESSFSG